MNVQVLQALGDEPKSLHDLRRLLGAPPETTTRANLRTLTKLGALERRQQKEFPGAVEVELTASGRELLALAEVLASWLARSPDRPVELGTVSAKNTVKALTEGWSEAIVRALAVGPLSLTQLSKLIAGVSYPSLERRLTAMRLAGLVEPCPGDGRATPYGVSEWLRRAAGPLAAAALWERHRARDWAPPLAKLDVEALFLLAVPMLELPQHLSGSCRLAVELGTAGGEPQFGGIVLEVKEGRIVSCVARLAGRADGWISGPSVRWLRAIAHGRADHLDIGGNSGLGLELLDGLHGALFQTQLRRPETAGIP